MPAAAHGLGNDAEAARKAQSGRTATGSAHALWLALPREAHRHEDAEALRSMLATAEGLGGGRRVPVGFAVLGDPNATAFISAGSGWIDPKVSVMRPNPIFKKRHSGDAKGVLLRLRRPKWAARADPAELAAPITSISNVCSDFLGFGVQIS